MVEGEEDPMQAGELIPIHTQHRTYNSMHTAHVMVKYAGIKM